MNKLQREDPVQFLAGLTFANAAEKVRAAGKGADQGAKFYDEALSKKLGIFLSPSVRTRLEQGRR